jgi:hypothetical protein
VITSRQLYRATPFVPTAVVSLAGIGDLKAFAPLVPLLCGPGILEHLTGEPSSGSRDAYADISPARLPAPQGHIVMISRILDKLARVAAKATGAISLDATGVRGSACQKESAPEPHAIWRPLIVHI